MAKENIFDKEAISAFYQKVLKEIIPNASHKSLSYVGPPTTKAGAIYLDLADTNDINKGSRYYYTKPYKFIHYTSLSNAINILRSKVIRLYSLNGMDDKQELSVSTKWLNKEISDYELAEIKKKIFCFSMCEIETETKRRSLPMWREYSQDGLGIGLVFSFDKKYANDWVHYMVSKVHYNEIFLKPFLEMHNKYNEFRKEHLLTITSFDEMFYKYYSFHKHPIYSHEKEVRLLYNQGFGLSDKPAVHYDILRGQKTCYLELELEWEWDKKTYDFIRSQSIEPKNVVPKITVDKVILGYRLSNTTKWEIADTIRELTKLYKKKPGLIESDLSDSFNVKPT